MIKQGILNADLRSLTARIGHRDRFAIVDAGNLLYERNPGGAPANVAVTVSRLGGKSGFLGTVSDDIFGHFLADAMTKFGVNIQGLRFTRKAPTKMAFITLDENNNRSFGAKFVTITLGPRGCYYSYKGGEGHLPTYDVKVADTTGSGDAFIGGFIYQLTRLNMPVIEQIPQPDIERMLRFAHACGALCASRKGAMPSVENEAEVERCMQEVPILLFD